MADHFLYQIVLQIAVEIWKIQFLNTAKLNF